MRLTAWVLELRFGASTDKSTRKISDGYQLFASTKLYNKNDGYQQINANNHYKEVALLLRGSADFLRKFKRVSRKSFLKGESLSESYP